MAKKRKEVNWTAIASELTKLTALRKKPFKKVRHVVFVYQLELMVQCALKNNLSLPEKEMLKAKAKSDYEEALVSLWDYLLSEPMKCVSPDTRSEIYHKREAIYDKAIAIFGKSLDENKPNSEEFALLKNDEFFRLYYSESERKLYDKVLAPSQNKNAIAPMDRPDSAFIPFTKAIQLASGVLSRKMLNKAIKYGKPVKVRSFKPSPQRINVHVQDILALIKVLSPSEEASEEAARMFSEFKKVFIKKQPPVNLD